MKEADVDMVEVREDDADLRQVLPALNALRTLPWGYQARRDGGPPLTMRFGLFQSSLSRQAEETYRESLRRIMLPRLLLRLEKYLAASSGQPMVLYEPLKVYLMLGNQGPMDPKAVQSWVTGDWATEVYPGSDSSAERTQLAAHLKALLEDTDLASVWPNRRAELNGQLIESARAEVQSMDPADRAYAVLRQRAGTAGEPWTVASILNPGDALAFANKDAVLRARVPYFFTRAGYEKTYMMGLTSIQRDVERDAWVLGGDAESVKAGIGNVRPGVASRYASDYVAAWENIIKVMEPADYFGNPVAYGAFTKQPSPLKKVLLELIKNTSFGGGAKAVAGRIVGERLNRNRVGMYLNDARDGRAAGLDAGAEIESYFSVIREYVGDGKNQAPVDEFVAAVREAGKAVSAARAIGGGGGSDSTQAAMASAVASVAAASTQAPPQLQGFVSQATKGGSSARVTAASGAVTDSYAQTVLPECREVAQERYPFFGAAVEDVAVADAFRVFGPGGVIDRLTQQRLMPLMDTSGPVWRWRSDDPTAAVLSPSSPEEFAKAAEVRELLTVGLQLRVAVEAMGSDVQSVEFSSGGATHTFTREMKVARPVTWSPQAAHEAYVQMASGKDGTEPVRIEAAGPWALFRLMDKADRENAGPKSIRARFGEGARSATLLFSLPSEKNPFSRGGMWSFRCPTTL
jgi:type VI secretion system protein ImpL